MNQTLLMKSRSLMVTVLLALSLAALIMLSGAASKAEAQSAAPDVSATNTVLEQLEDDGELDSNVSDSPGFPSVTPSTATDVGTATSTASASAPASASATASAAQDQYQERPDTDGKAVASAETTEAKQLPNTGSGTDGKVAAPAETTEATGLQETNRNSSVLPLVLGSSALLVGGGLLARRLIR
jgi:hypothetical protein